MVIAIKNLDAALGAEIADIDLTKPLPRADIDAIKPLGVSGSSSSSMGNPSQIPNSSLSARTLGSWTHRVRTPTASPSTESTPSST